MNADTKLCFEKLLNQPIYRAKQILKYTSNFIIKDLAKHYKIDFTNREEVINKIAELV